LDRNDDSEVELREMEHAFLSSRNGLGVRL